MTPSILYLCESSGARILAVGAGVTQLGTEYQAQLETWDVIPAGEAGDVYFRGIDCTVEYSNGFNIGITPIVDGIELTEQIFTGTGTGTQPLQATIAERGARMAARARTISRSGDIAFENLQAQCVIIREVP